MKPSLFLLLALAPAVAAAEPPASSAGRAYNPNETICRVTGETGSRLNRSRVCMTRAQWEAHQRNTQRDVEHAQTTRVNQGAQ